jgi:hypothetical protein
MEQLEEKNIRGVLRLAKSKGYKIYDRPYELNIWGIRSQSTVPNKFDDKLAVFWKDDKNKWQGKMYVVTTDPGTFWLKEPMSKLGAAILKEGQYVGAYKTGLHKGKEALVQSKPVTVIRDYDRDAVLDFDNGREETGMFGINIHRAGEDSQNVDKWSAGCQVFQNTKSIEEFLTLAKKHKALYGDGFTYTLVDERAYLRRIKRRGLYIVMGVLTAAALYVGYRAYNNKKIIPKM